MNSPSQNDAGTILKTTNFAAIKHKDQRRKDSSSTPYINHPIGVAQILLEAGINDIETLQAALLHDTVEDTNTSFEELEKEFGVSVTNIVREVTDDKSLPKAERKKLQIEHAKHASTQAKLVKLADKQYNLRDLLRSPPCGWNAENIQGYFCWAAAVIDVIRGTNQVLEKQLDDIFSKSFTIDGVTYPVLIPAEERVAFLEKYYQNMN